MSVDDHNKFVFREGPEGLELVGDFEGLYQAVEDPWDQSAENKSYGVERYYGNSRVNLVSVLRRRAGGASIRGLEIGCGHGHVVDCLADSLGQFWHGVDVSATAVKKARELYPERSFSVGNILEEVNGGVRYDVVVLGQLLWYIFHKMDMVMGNCYDLLVPNGLLVVSQAFLTSEQRYGKDIADGFDGAVKLLIEQRPHFRLIEARYEDRLGYAHNDGLIIMRKAL